MEKNRQYDIAMADLSNIQCFAIDFAIESMKKLQEIEQIIKRPEGFSQEEKAYNNMIKVADIRKVLEE